MSNANTLVEGYPRLAAQMGHYPETGIYRRFASLNSQNLLYLQAELVHLEKKVRQLETAASREQGGNKYLYAKDWYWLKVSAEDGENELWQTVQETKAKLKEYNDALLQQVTLSALPEPNAYSLRTLRHWLQERSLGNLALIGEDSKVWGAASEPLNHASDLIVIRGQPTIDRFSKWFVERFLVWFHRRFWHQVKQLNDIESGMAVYEDENLIRYTSHATTIVASLLPVISTIILYRVQDIGLRLGITAIFTFIFVFCLAFFTDAQAPEIFAATAAFSAVQVVFISGNGLPVSH
ncbi:uncharacterized protein K444DRAFT_525568 [Hyaloscypha bicolor E]|uniref:DUF6594 domain-containing protein n=1 Tax=Hyaloscypha bicolor E TaxID=1095630 RepID=A0A2J6TG90_9HELO|nr:uncharacterized protein K444DRAFT_525568 [Hyaloscypha bicolor E]PMD62034.1 hypothetical protein K444DRAFT_525568 [Hyaloscypha bicolor E]